MELLKTPHQMLLEEAGAIPQTPGMVNTPQELLMQKSGVMPHFDTGDAITSQDMLADMLAHGITPQHFAKGGAPEEQMTFNIGKNIGDRLNALSDAEIKKHLEKAGHKIMDYKVVPPRPNTEFGPFEHTAVVTTKGNPQNLAEKTWALSNALQQQAIPVQTDSQKVLAGPAADKWGPFSEQHFVPQHGVQAAGNKAHISDKALELMNKAKLAVKHHPFQSAFNALNFTDVIGNAYDTLDNLRHSKPVQALESGFNAISSIPAALPSVPAAVSMAVPVGGKMITDAATEYAAQHPEYTSQMRNMASSPLGGAFAGDSGLASYILGDRDYSDVIKNRQPE
jgi:hypothetical protein